MSYTPPVGSVDLKFVRLRPSGADLDFVTGTLVATLAGSMRLRMRAGGLLVQTVALSGSAGLGIRAAGTLVMRRTCSTTAAACWFPAKSTNRASSAPWPASQAMEAARAVAWIAGAPAGVTSAARWDQLATADRAGRVPWDQLRPLARWSNAAWARTWATDLARRAPWGTLGVFTRSAAAAYRYPVPRDHAARLRWLLLAPRNRGADLPWPRCVALDQARPRLPWGDGEPPWLKRPPLGAAGADPPAQPVAPAAYTPPTGTVNLCFWQPAPADVDLSFRRHLDPCKLRSTLTMIHTAALVRLPERTPIPLLAARLDYAAGDMAWSAKLTLPTRAGLDLVAPTITGLREVELTMDGHVWWFVVEGYSEDRQFGAPVLSVDGRSPSAWLGAPYARPAPQPTANPYTARQLAELAVADAGWSIDWQIVDWLVPAGAWRHDPMTPIDAVMAIAAAAGAVAVPARAARSLTIRYTHPTPRWAWPTAAPDRVISPSRLVRVGVQYRPADDYDKVYVFGEVGGVAAGVKRAGFAGNTPAPTVIDPLVTHVDCARERGRQALSASGTRLAITLDQPFADTDNGITPVWPGLLVEVAEDAPWRALATGIAIDLQRLQGDSGPLVAAQAITLERAQ